MKKFARSFFGALAVSALALVGVSASYADDFTLNDEPVAEAADLAVDAAVDDAVDTIETEVTVPDDAAVDFASAFGRPARLGDRTHTRPIPPALMRDYLPINDRRDNLDSLVDPSVMPQPEGGRGRFGCGRRHCGPAPCAPYAPCDVCGPAPIILPAPCDPCAPCVKPCKPCRHICKKRACNPCVAPVPCAPPAPIVLPAPCDPCAPCAKPCKPCRHICKKRACNPCVAPVPCAPPAPIALPAPAPCSSCQPAIKKPIVVIITDDGSVPTL